MKPIFFIFKILHTTRFPAQREPVLNEPGQKFNKQAILFWSVFSVPSWTAFKINRKQAKLTKILAQWVISTTYAKNVNCQPSCIFFLNWEIFLVGTYEEGAIPVVKVCDWETCYVVRWFCQNILKEIEIDDTDLKIALYITKYEIHPLSTYTKHGNDTGLTKWLHDYIT